MVGVQQVCYHSWRRAARGGLGEPCKISGLTCHRRQLRAVLSRLRSVGPKRPSQIMSFVRSPSSECALWSSSAAHRELIEARRASSPPFITA